MTLVDVFDKHNGGQTITVEVFDSMYRHSVTSVEVFDKHSDPPPPLVEVFDETH